MSVFKPKNKDYIKPIDETDLYVLFKEFEDVFLFEKDTNKELWRTSFYGEATCGLISLTTDWIVVGGNHMALWENRKLEIINDENLKWIFDIRQVGDYEIEILTDPWSENSAIWKFNILNKSKIKIRNFEEYKKKEYTDNVKW